MRGGVSFTPCPLLSRAVVSHRDAESEVLRLRFALPAGAVLGHSQPTTHVKVRYPVGLLPRARTFSITSPEEAVGYFEIVVKVHPSGRVSPFLAALRPGEVAHFALTLTKRLAAPLDGPLARGCHLALIAFGVGAAELVLTAPRAAAAGQTVRVLLAVRTSRDAVLLPELFQASALAKGALSVIVAISREEPSAELLARAAEASAAGADVSLVCGRVDAASVAKAFPRASWASAAALCVGTRAQARAAYALLRDESDVHQRLLGRPVIWGCW